MNNLRRVRLSVDISQLELMRRTGIYFSTISKIERGWVKPTKKQRKKLARVLKVSEDHLFPEAKNEKNNFSNEGWRSWSQCIFLEWRAKYKNGLMYRGYIHLWRKVNDNPLWPENEGRKFTKYEAWESLVLDAVGIEKIQGYRDQGISLKRRQLIISERKRSEKWKWSRDKVRNFFAYLHRNHMISYRRILKHHESTKKN